MLTEEFKFYSGIELPETLLNKIKGAAEISMDIEADGLHHYYAKTCLIQLNIDGSIYIVDPLVNVNISELFFAMEGKQIILHSGSYDLRLLKKDFNFVPYKIFDTSIAMQLLGYEKLGLADLVERHFNIILEKGPQKMDWSQRPLPDKMFNYSANDVKYLPELRRRLTVELKTAGRLEWMEENCRHLIESAAQADEKHLEDELWRIKGSTFLTRKQLAYLKELWLWREDEAQAADVPVFKIVKNELLISMARWCASDGKHIFNYPGFEHIKMRKKRMANCDKAMQAAKCLTPAEWPQKKKPVSGMHRDVDGTVLEQIKAARDRISENLQLPPPIIASQKTLSLIASMNISSTEDLVKKCGMYKWQKELLKKDIIKIFNLSY